MHATCKPCMAAQLLQSRRHSRWQNTFGKEHCSGRKELMHFTERLNDARSVIHSSLTNLKELKNKKASWSRLFSLKSIAISRMLRELNTASPLDFDVCPASVCKPYLQSRFWFEFSQGSHHNHMASLRFLGRETYIY
jgi:hypothetical protein